MMHASRSLRVARARVAAVVVALGADRRPRRRSRAQSNLSTQGFGFPTGQLSARALGAGGSLGEMDPLSPVNPATIALLGRAILFFQIEPEYRTVTTAERHASARRRRAIRTYSARCRSAREFVVSLGASTLLDRTATTSFNSDAVPHGGDSVPMTTTFGIDGAMDDVRLAAAGRRSRWLRLGLGAHAITGHNLVSADAVVRRLRTRSPRSRSRACSASAAARCRPASSWSRARRGIGVRFAQGGALRHDRAEDTVLSRPRVPNRFGASLAYTGIANSAISVRTSHDNWSSLGALGSPGLVGVDAWDTSVGADIAGPQIGDRIVFLRGGFRDRTLPFQAAGQTVTEKSVTGGTRHDVRQRARPHRPRADPRDPHGRQRRRVGACVDDQHRDQRSAVTRSWKPTRRPPTHR